jgi:cellulose biosynthesis protein BcsQ
MAVNGDPVDQEPPQLVELTPEQQNIVKAVSTGRNILVAALAGTGKTSTLLSIARAYPRRKGLYLAYNKTLQLEARGKFPPCVTCKTIHGLAYQDVGICYTAQLSRKLHISTIVDCFNIQPLRHAKYFASAELIAASANDMVKTFSYSLDYDLQPSHYSRRCVDRLLDKYKGLKVNLENIENPKTFMDYFLAKSWHYAKGLWHAMSDPGNDLIPANHDTYLKLYQLKEPVIEGYDYIMLDEAQDANASILDILSRQNVQRIYVGDENQQIYGFRGTINAMAAIQGDTYCLTQSFRFGDAIAEEANKVLKALNVQNLIKGYASIQSRVCPVNERLPYTFIARTNAELIKAIVSKRSAGKKIHFVGDVDKVLSLFESAYFLKKDQLSKMADFAMKRFDSWDKFVREAKLSQDHEYLGIINFIYDYHDQAPKILKLIKALCSYGEGEADIIMTTAHKAKGRQWSQVHVHDDFLSNDTIEEKNIYYVALTRAVDVLHSSVKVMS